MDRTLKRKLALAAAATLAVAGGGAAIAATQDTSPKAESDAVVSDAAKQLGVQPAALSAALKKALENRIDAAVADGRLTKAQGDAAKQRIESAEFPIFGRGGRHFGGPFGEHHLGGLTAAASYLGLTRAQLRTELESGKTLAQVATAHGKTVDGLVQALVADMTKKLDAAVAAGRLTKAQEQTILADLPARIRARVNGERPRGMFFFHGGRRAFDRAPADVLVPVA